MFLTTLWYTTSIKFAISSLKSIGTILNTFVFKSFKLVGILTNSLISSSSTSAFRAIKSFLAAKSNISTPVACSNYFLVT